MGTESQLNSGGSVEVNFTGGWPSSAGTYYILARTTATDDISNTANNNAASPGITVTAAPVANVDYYVNALPAGGTSALTDSGISDSFTIKNLGTAAGSQNVYWTAYISTNTTLETGTDTVIDTGSISSLNADETSGLIMFTGKWPETAGTYYLLFGVSAGEDINSVNDITATPADYTISEPDIDYLLTAGSFSNTGNPAISGSSINESFTITNDGDDNGSDTVYWTAFISPDEIYNDSNDIPIDYGTITSLNAGAVSPAILINNGSWDEVDISTDFYLYISISASDETAGNTVNNTLYYTFTINPLEIDYIVTPGSITTTGNPALGGGSISETFSIKNNAADNGSDNVYWTAYISSDTNFDDPGDTPVDSGWITSLNGGDVSADITIDSGNWPVVSTTTDYYLFVNVSSSDETTGNDTNNDDYVTFTVNVPDIDYELISVTNNGSPANVGDGIAETFEVQNTGGNNGSADILWTAYISSDTTLDGTDTEIDSGNTTALNSGVPSGDIGITGTWSEGAGNFYLIVSVSSSDEKDATNNKLVSGAFTITAPGSVDYTVSAVTSSFTTATTGGTLSESFDITNVGGNTGAAVINWEVFASTDTVWDGTDQSLGSGSITTGPIAGDTISGIDIIQHWNVSSPGDYFLIVKLNSTDDILTGNNTGYSGPFTVNDPPDYIFESVNLPIDIYGGNLMENINDAAGAHHFTIRESAGYPGKQTISWTAYISTDTILSGGDPILDSGTNAALGAGDPTASIPIDGQLPVTNGYYYIILQLTAGDDSNTGNNSYVSSKIYVWDTVNNDTDTDDDEYLSDAEDYSILLNVGDTVTINGTIDAPSFYDHFKLKTGENVADLEVLLTWSTGEDTLDSLIYDDYGSIVDQSQDKTADEEPKAAQQPFMTSVNPFTIYYPTAWVFFPGNTGDPYVMTVTAH